ncbi:hypothetical protein MRB53_006204 [Persea americana]|uniref:Uncharacterized protein n=1 Tax=Persea americana TaxID=3435 RepID=A0ACC2MFA3_PERAE|nr:hypothetical protein MRB53_006204 [Persea americana]
MEPKGVKIIASAVVISLLILITIFRVTLGHSTAFYLVTGAACAAILAVVIWALFQYATVYSRTKTLTNRTALEGEQLRLEYSFLRKAAGLPAKFRYEELEAATDNFKALLGRGSSAYGMVLLEIFGGRRNVRLVGDGSNSQRKWSYFPRIVSEKVKEGKLMEVLDEKLKGGGVEEREVRVLVNVALWCIQEKAKLRPSMARVVDMLEGRLLVDKPPETEMIIVDLLSIDDDNLTGAGGSRQMQSKPPTMSTYSCGLSVLSGR